MMRFLSRYRKLLLVAPLALSVLPGCTREGKFSPVDMWNRSRYKPYEPAAFFDDNNSSRVPVRNTVARGQLRIDDAMYSGFVNGRYSNTFPMPVTKEMLGRGQERFNIYCMPCHGVAGRADGMIVKRGFSPPPDYRIARLRNAPVGHFYEVITNGYGAMYSYASRVPPRDRWAIAAYIRFLQERQPGTVPDVRYKVENSVNKGATVVPTPGTEVTSASAPSGAAQESHEAANSASGHGAPGEAAPAAPAPPASGSTMGALERR